MPKKSATTWSGGSVKLDTADKKQLAATPQQQHNLSIAPNRNVGGEDNPIELSDSDDEL